MLENDERESFALPLEVEILHKKVILHKVLKNRPTPVG